MTLLDFLLVAGVTAIVVFIVTAFVLWLTARARMRRRAAAATTAEAGRAQVSE